MTKTVVTISNISKRFKKNEEFFYALKGINLNVQKGEVLGVLGKNGSGKSTLLKILSGILKPDEGRIEITGKVASILDVGTGMHPDLTGRQNLYLRGQLLGLSKAEITSIFDELVAFSEIGDFIDTPVKHYSSGMFVRLAFSIIVFLRAEILILDEVMSVGDVGFMQKCNDKLIELTQKEDTTVIVVGHNIHQLGRIATRAITLDHGEIAFEGDTPTAIEHYVKLSRTYYSKNSIASLGIHIERSTLKLSNQHLEIELRYSCSDNPYYPVARVRKLNQELLIINGTEKFQDFKASIKEKNQTIQFMVKVDLSIMNGGKFFVHYFFADGDNIYDADHSDSFSIPLDETLQNQLLNPENLVFIEYR